MSSIPVVLPWAADGLIPEEADHATAHVNRALALIQIESLDGGQRLGSLDGFALADSAIMPGSLERLAPGEAALLRLPAQWRSSGAGLADHVHEENGQLRIRERLALLDDAAASATSANAETVVVVRNHYSIPHIHVRRPLTLLASATLVRVLAGADEIARHDRRYDTNLTIGHAAHA